jgi:hypothetical protein
MTSQPRDPYLSTFFLRKEEGLPTGDALALQREVWRHTAPESFRYDVHQFRVNNDPINIEDGADNYVVLTWQLPSSWKTVKV